MNSPVPFDAKRREAGLPGYTGQWDPKTPPNSFIWPRGSTGAMPRAAFPNAARMARRVPAIAGALALFLKQGRNHYGSQRL